MARRKEAHGGGHGWFVTFADLMGLLVSFFVMLVAFSSQDSKKMQAVAGSMRDAFGVQKIAHFSGIMETYGLPTRPTIKNAAHVRPEDTSITPTPDEHGSDSSTDQTFALAAASLRRSLQNLPDLAEASKHIMVEDTKEGLDIEVVDQDGSSMFAEGSSQPNARSGLLFSKLAGLLRTVPYRISISGHTSAPPALPEPQNEGWNLSTERANAVRRIFEENGYPSDHIYKVAGRADNEPLISDDPSAAPNRRVTIALLHEAPPVPPELTP